MSSISGNDMVSLDEYEAQLLSPCRECSKCLWKLGKTGQYDTVLTILVYCQCLVCASVCISLYSTAVDRTILLIA